MYLVLLEVVQKALVVLRKLTETKYFSSSGTKQNADEVFSLGRSALQSRSTSTYFNYTDHGIYRSM